MLETELVTKLTRAELRALIRRLRHASDRAWDAYVFVSRSDKRLMAMSAETNNLAMYLYHQI